MLTEILIECLLPFFLEATWTRVLPELCSLAEITKILKITCYFINFVAYSKKVESILYVKKNSCYRRDRIHRFAHGS